MLRVVLNVNKDESDERVEVYARDMTDTLEEMIRLAERSGNHHTLFGKKGDDIFPLQINDIVRIYIEDKVVYAEIGMERFRIEGRIYELEERLPADFIRISQSEIVHTKFLQKLKLELTGFIQITLKNGVTTYSSRRYVKKIKEALQL